MRRDPLADPAPLVRRVYAYVAYRLGDGPDAEDVTSDVFERAVRYRSSFDGRRGDALPWLLGIARRCIADAGAARVPIPSDDLPEPADPRPLEEDAVRRLELRAAVEQLDPRSRELVALRFGADLTARQIAELLDERTITIEVALHRALRRLEEVLGESDPDPAGVAGRDEAHGGASGSL
jgi:RNA polymerase sigma-70 factor (ECF subfamily)